MRAILPILLLLALLAAAVLLDRPRQPADLTFINRGEVHTLDPQRMSWLQDFRIADSIYEGLVRWDNDTFEILPGVAESWDISADGLTYTFHLRGNARWSNGDPVTAHDFVYAWRRALFPDTAAGYADLFYRLRGGQEFFNWRRGQLATFVEEARGLSEVRRRQLAQQRLDEARRRFDETVGLAAKDDRTLIVTLEVPTPYMLDLLAFGPFMPVHPPTVEAHVSLDPATGSLRQRHGWTKPPHLIGNGPYVLSVWRYKRDLRLERNDRYWNAGSVGSDSVLCVYVEDANTAVLAYKTGSIDWLSDVSVDYRADMMAQKQRYMVRNAARSDELEAEGLGYNEIMAVLARESPPLPGERNDIHAFAAYGTYFFNFNCQPTLNSGAFNPFKDARVRRAFSRSVDKHAIVDRVTRMGQPVAHTLIPPGSIAGFSGAEGLQYDPAMARRELAEAGWSDRNGDGLVEDESGSPFPTVEILFPSSTEHKAISQAIANMWERELGVRTRLREEETKVAGTHLVEHNFMVARGNWFGDYGDPTTFLDIHRTGNSNNDRNYSNPVFDDLMARSDAELDPEKRMRLLEEAEAMIENDAAPLLPLFHQVTLYMYDPARLRNISTHPRLTQFLHELEVVR